MFNFKGKRLYRRPKDAIVLGIAAGLGDYLEIDPVFVRLVWLALTVLTHVWPLIILYIVLFFVVPIDPSQDSVPAHQEPKDVTDSARMDSDQNM